MPSGKVSKKDKQAAAAPTTLTGTFIFPNGERYEGEYIELNPGQIERSGEGTHQFTDGMTYTGQWVKDRMSGRGEMKHPSGAVYKGEFVENEYHGTGTFTWSDGSLYRGDFSHNRMEGKGEFTDATGREWVGVFSGKTARELKLKLI